MSKPLQLTPTAAAELREFLVVDIRPVHERFCGQGFIPGSLHVDTEDNPMALDQLRQLGHRSSLVLACMTGRRSDALALALKTVDASLVVANLSGGLLGWHAAQLPVAAGGVEWDEDEARRPLSGETCRLIASCFMAETVELSLDNEADLDPMALFNRCLAEAESRPSLRMHGAFFGCSITPRREPGRSGMPTTESPRTSTKILAVIGMSPATATGQISEQSGFESR